MDLNNFFSKRIYGCKRFHPYINVIYLFVHCKYIYLGVKGPVNIGLGILNLNCLFTF